MWEGAGGDEGSAYVLYVALFLLVGLEYLEELLVGIWVVGVAGLYLVEVLDCVVEFAGGLGVEGIPGAEPAEEGGGGGGGGGEAEGEGVEGSVGGLGSGAGGGGDADGVRITWVGGDVDPVAGGEEGVEALYEGGVAVEEHGDAVDDAGGVDPGGMQQGGGEGRGDLHLALEVLHDVEEVVVHVGLVVELDLDCIEVAERVGDVERAGELGRHGGRGRPWEPRAGSKIGRRHGWTTLARCLPGETTASTSRPSSPTTSSSSPPCSPSYVPLPSPPSRSPPPRQLAWFIAFVAQAIATALSISLLFLPRPRSPPLSSRKCRLFLVRHLPPALPHPRRHPHPRNRLHRDAPVPDIHLWRSRNRLRSLQRKREHILRSRRSRRNGRRLAHPRNRRHPLGPLLHLRGRLPRPPPLQLSRNRRSLFPLPSSQNPRPLHSQRGLKRLRGQLLRRRGHRLTGHPLRPRRENAHNRPRSRKEPEQLRRRW